MDDDKASGQLLKLDATVNMDDVVALKLSEVEGQLKTADRDQQKLITAITKKIADGEKAIVLIATQAGEAAIKDKLNAVVEAAKVLIPTVTSTFKAYACPGDEPKIRVEFGIYSQGGHYGITGVEDIPFPDEITQQYADLEAAIAEKATLTGRAVEIRKAIGQMAFFERQVRGELAKIRLSATDGGLELVQKLNAFSVAGLEGLDLPVLPAPAPASTPTPAD